MELNSSEGNLFNYLHAQKIGKHCLKEEGHSQCLSLPEMLPYSGTHPSVPGDTLPSAKKDDMVLWYIGILSPNIFMSLKWLLTNHFYSDMFFN